MRNRTQHPKIEIYTAKFKKLSHRSIIIAPGIEEMLLPNSRNSGAAVKPKGMPYLISKHWVMITITGLYIHRTQSSHT
jgi:hypothetical protein